MIHVEQHGPVVAIRMARSLFGRPLYWSSAYWVDGLLIDSGPSCTADELVRLLEQVHVDRVVITHGHEDTIGGLAQISEHFPDAQLYASPRALSVIGEPALLQMQMYRRLVWGTPEPVADVASLDEVENVIETPEFTFRVVETPGHSRDHISLFEPGHRWVFCGDAFMVGRDEAWAPEFDMFGIISSLRTLASLRPERLFTGSGSVRRTPLPEIHQKIRQLTELAREVTRLDAVGLTVSEMVACLFQEEPRLTFWTRGHFSAANLIEACRIYNALVTPLDELNDSSPSTHSRPHPKRPSNSPGSSAKNRPDKSDWLQ